MIISKISLHNVTNIQNYLETTLNIYNFTYQLLKLSVFKKKKNPKIKHFGIYIYWLLLSLPNKKKQS